MIIVEEYEQDMSQNTNRCLCTGCRQMRMLAVFTLLEMQDDLRVRWDARVILRRWEVWLADGHEPMAGELAAIEEAALTRCLQWVQDNRAQVRFVSSVIGWSGSNIN